MTSDLRLKFEIEARILAGQSDDEIAAKTGCSPETVYWFEALHFCARDRLEYPGYVVTMTKKGPIYEENWAEFEQLTVGCNTMLRVTGQIERYAHLSLKLKEAKERATERRTKTLQSKSTVSEEIEK